MGHCIGVGSGTDALVLGLRLLGAGAGDAVVTVSHTASATAAAIELAGATPLLVDVEPGGFTMSPSALQTVLESTPLPVKAVVPVHLYGQPAPIEEIVRVADAHGLPVLEDVAQAHGAAVAGRKVGGFGALAAFSFYPTKNLGGIGDGGALVTNDAGLAERARSLRQYGWRRRHISEEPGLNTRLDELQAAILRVKLPRLNVDNRRRQEIAAAYDAGLRDLPLVLPARRAGETHVFHQYVVRTPERERLRQKLEGQGVGAAVHYPQPVHRQPAYERRFLLGRGGLGETERLVDEILSLPIFPQLDDTSVQRVIAVVRSAFD